ncbi:DMT family transporter [Oricola sp.]|uniref:DMT family transporter n=1 Tax=Oricola sp. TaxID=1979950 RepID=UPI00320BDC51|nr:DMT family transporter [Oricola sp.]
MSSSPSSPSPLPYLVMLAAPLFFSTNLIFGRYVTGEVTPFLLATIRWAAVAAILSPLLYLHRDTVVPLFRNQWKRLIVLGFLGMGICGGGIYLALKYTTATNGTLIYTTSPVLIILLERLFLGRRSHFREMAGTLIAFAGVAVIVLRGSLETALSLSFNIGDLLVFAGAISWAGYSILYRSEPVRHVGNLPLFALVAIFGALSNLPIALWELAQGDALPTEAHSWAAIAGIVLISSLLAFSTFQYGVRVLGASIAGVFMYLLPPYGVGLAIVFLGEEFYTYHAAGIALVMAGVITATFPSKLLGRLRAKPA